MFFTRRSLVTFLISINSPKAIESATLSALSVQDGIKLGFVEVVSQSQNSQPQSFPTVKNRDVVNSTEAQRINLANEQINLISVSQQQLGNKDSSVAEVYNWKRSFFNPCFYFAFLTFVEIRKWTMQTFVADSSRQVLM